MRELGSSQPTAVELEILPRDESRLDAAEIRTRRAEFLGRAEAIGRDRRGSVRIPLLDGDAAPCRLHRLRSIP